MASIETTGGSREEPKRPLRYRLLPRTAFGLVALALAASVGAAFSGTILFAYYSYQLDKVNSQVSSFVAGFDQRYKTAVQTIQNDTANGQASISQSLQPLLKSEAVGTQMASVLKKAAPAVWLVHTLDQNGAVAAGSAFVVAADNNQSLMLASYTTVQAATVQPAPAITVSQGTNQVKATLWSWDPENDLALLIVNQGNLPHLNFATAGPGVAVGDRVFAVSGLGNGGSISQGFVNASASNVVQDDAAVGTAGQGGPVLDAAGDVVGIASLVYHPLGFTSTGVYFTVPVLQSCVRVLRCPGGTIGGVGTQGG